MYVPYMYYFSTACRRELVAIFKVNCFPFLNCFASSLLHIILLPALPSRTMYSLLLHLDPHEKISSQIQDLFCSRKPLTYPGSASVQCGLHGRTDYRLSQALTFFTQTNVSYRTLLLSRKYHKCPCISRTFFHKIEAQNQGCSLSSDTSVFGVLKHRN